MIDMAIPEVSVTTWAEVEVRKASLVSVYRGRISDAVMRALLEGTDLTYVTLFDAGWYTDRDEEFVIMGQTRGPYRHSTGVIHIRAKDILCVLPLLDGRDLDRGAQ